MSCLFGLAAVGPDWFVQLICLEPNAHISLLLRRSTSNNLRQHHDVTLPTLLGRVSAVGLLNLRCCGHVMRVFFGYLGEGFVSSNLRWTQWNCKGTANHFEWNCQFTCQWYPKIQDYQHFCWFSKMRLACHSYWLCFKGFIWVFSVFVLCKMMRFDVNVNPTLINVDGRHRVPTLGYYDINS